MSENKHSTTFRLDIWGNKDWVTYQYFDTREELLDDLADDGLIQYDFRIVELRTVVEEHIAFSTRE